MKNRSIASLTFNDLVKEINDSKSSNAKKDIAVEWITESSYASILSVGNLVTIINALDSQDNAINSEVLELALKRISNLTLTAAEDLNNLFNKQNSLGLKVFEHYLESSRDNLSLEDFCETIKSNFQDKSTIASYIALWLKSNTSDEVGVLDVSSKLLPLVGDDPIYYSKIFNAFKDSNPGHAITTDNLDGASDYLKEYIIFRFGEKPDPAGYGFGEGSDLDALKNSLKPESKEKNTILVEAFLENKNMKTPLFPSLISSKTSLLDLGKVLKDFIKNSEFITYQAINSHCEIINSSPVLYYKEALENRVLRFEEDFPTLLSCLEKCVDYKGSTETNIAALLKSFIESGREVNEDDFLRIMGMEKGIEGYNIANVWFENNIEKIPNLNNILTSKLLNPDAKTLDNTKKSLLKAWINNYPEKLTLKDLENIEDKHIRSYLVGEFLNKIPTEEIPSLEDLLSSKIFKRSTEENHDVLMKWLKVFPGNVSLDDIKLIKKVPDANTLSIISQWLKYSKVKPTFKELIKDGLFHPRERKGKMIYHYSKNGFIETIQEFIKSNTDATIELEEYCYENTSSLLTSKNKDFLSKSANTIVKNCEDPLDSSSIKSSPLFAYVNYLVTIKSRDYLTDDFKINFGDTDSLDPDKATDREDLRKSFIKAFNSGFEEDILEFVNCLDRKFLSNDPEVGLFEEGSIKLFSEGWNNIKTAIAEVLEKDFNQFILSAYSINDGCSANIGSMLNIIIYNALAESSVRDNTSDADKKALSIVIKILSDDIIPDVSNNNNNENPDLLYIDNNPFQNSRLQQETLLSRPLLSKIVESFTAADAADFITNSVRDNKFLENLIETCEDKGKDKINGFKNEDITQVLASYNLLSRMFLEKELRSTYPDIAEFVDKLLAPERESPSTSPNTNINSPNTPIINNNQRTV